MLAEDFEEDTNFVQEYLNAYTQAFGEEFTKDLEEQSDAIYDIAVTMKGENSDGEEITILDSLEILAAEGRQLRRAGISGNRHKRQYGCPRKTCICFG